MLANSKRWIPLATFLVVTTVVVSSAAQDKPSDQAADKIRQALESNAKVEPTGDGVLDDVLKVIKRQGSIIDGSILDDSADPESAVPVKTNQNALVAEQLLKASRMLERLERTSTKRKDLIKRMRAEAANLLTE